MNKKTTNSPRTGDTSVTNVRKSRKKSAKKTEKTNTFAANASPVRHAFVPIVQQFRKHTKKNEARLWIPIETSLLVRYEFASCSLQTRYVFVAIVLFCGANGIDKIPLDAKFMSSVLVADERTIAKSFKELLSKNLLQEREKEREEEKEKTDRQKEKNGVSVDSENSQIKEEEKEFDKNISSNGHLSQFSLDECLKYVEKCQTAGDEIRSPKALARNLYKTGEADSFILATLYPEKQLEIDQEVYGPVVQFTDDPCRVCFGAKMADTDGKGFRSCDHCKNEKGKSTGFEPQEVVRKEENENDEK